MVKNVARITKDVLIRLQEKRENRYRKKDQKTIQSALFFGSNFKELQQIER